MTPSYHRQIVTATLSVQNL